MEGGGVLLGGILIRGGDYYLSHATCLKRPRLFYALCIGVQGRGVIICVLFIIIISCCIIVITSCYIVYMFTITIIIIIITQFEYKYGIVCSEGFIIGCYIIRDF